MQLTLQESAQGHNLYRALTLTAVGCTVLWMVAFFARRIDPIVDAMWFGLDEPEYFGRIGTRWFSLCAAALILLFTSECIKSVSAGLAGSGAARFWSTFIRFLFVLYSVLFFHIAALANIHGAPSPGSFLFDCSHLIFSSIITCMSWKSAFDKRGHKISASSLLAFTVMTGLCVLVWLEPDFLPLLLSTAGIIEPLMDVVIYGDFFEYTPYFFPIFPLMLAAIHEYRQPAPAAS